MAPRTPGDHNGATAGLPLQVVRDVAFPPWCTLISWPNSIQWTYFPKDWQVLHERDVFDVTEDADKLQSPKYAKRDVERTAKEKNRSSTSGYVVPSFNTAFLIAVQTRELDVI